MATEGNQTKVGSAAAFHHVSPLSSGSRPSKHDKYATNLQEARRSSAQQWLSKQRSCPSLLLHRKPSCDDVKGTFLDKHCEEYKCNLKVISPKEKVLKEVSTAKHVERKTMTCRNNSEGPMFLDSAEDNMNEGGNKSTSSPCSCGMSSFERSMNSCLCDNPQHSPSPGSSPVHHCYLRRGSVPVSFLAFRKSGPSSEPSSLASSPCGSPQLCLRKHHKNCHIPLCHLKDGYSSLERLNRRPKIKKCSLDKVFSQSPSLEMIPTALEASAGGATICNSGSNSSGEEEGDILSDSREFDNKKRSTVLVRRYCKNNEKVIKSVSAGTSAIVKELPSGCISEDTCGIVIEHAVWRPRKEDLWPILTRAEHFRVCREMLRSVRVSPHLVRAADGIESKLETCHDNSSEY
ncbi:PREDICTED: 1-phosphatidylinositol 4,5-bisphosphate phosphodiesterase epsilon-1 isoform X1 [Poecilia mexicana]|uniref:1-phosphatidylinositol 4,5-bisphosphate phosphodiesterase epsilon-1 isoform X1 n=1 Tax=Poecilia mexicana TaxID=48701 RepID=UPI00072DED35|nr:PREDICTED: 1-phosphatidylinositol 4,5-bisphosphate phosphodiesterase epsilon-1 isoform X1 [Poecilia mexicana]